MNKESYFISRFPDTRIGDDGVTIGTRVYSMDAFFENVHFKREWMSLEQIARKAMLVNLSDAVAMNAEPRFALLTVAIPPSFSLSDLDELARGFIQTAREFGVSIIGGDTIANTKLDITITIISESRHPLRRSGIRSNDLIAYTGDLGRSARDLARLMRGGRLDSASRFMRPTLRSRFIQKSRRYLHAGMDISDGLGTELGRLSKMNRTGFRFLDTIKKEVLCSGEEYEMLIAFPRHHRRAVFRLARQSRTPLTLVAKACAGRYRPRCKMHHF